MSDTDLRIVVVVPSGTHWLADFGASLLSMMGYFMNNPVKGMRTHEFRLVNIKGSILSTSRLNGIKAAKAMDASHLLFIVSDHTFPPDMLNQLLSWKKDVVAANCVTKSIPACTTARSFSATDPQGDIVYSDEKMVHNLERVWRVGTGVMLISKRAYNQIPHDCFTIKYMPEADVYQGEDWTMCEAMDKLGIPIYVDHKLSREVGHLGILNFTHDYVGSIIRDEIRDNVTSIRS